MFSCFFHKLNFLTFSFILISTSNNSCSNKFEGSNLPVLADTNRLKNDLINIVHFTRRNYLYTDYLDSARDYIKGEFLKITPDVEMQSYLALGPILYYNVICSLGPANAERIIIGAHYDVCGEQPGADDNASGVAGLLELARLLKNDSLKYRIDFVAYTLEEPPFFATTLMGSYIHAKYLFEKKIPVKGMLCLEMIGYFNDAENSQKYPLGFLKWFYGNKGDFITIVQKFNNGKFGRELKSILKKEHSLPTKFFKGPKGLAGIGLSDHRNYWHFGYSAVMVTNTAFYRDKNYHTPEDKPEKLDVKRMGFVVDELYNAIKKINKK